MQVSFFRNLVVWNSKEKKTKYFSMQCIQQIADDPVLFDFNLREML